MSLRWEKGGSFDVIVTTLDLLINEMLPAIYEEKLADYIDVFCETNYFNVDELDMILEAGAKYNLKPKVHVNQFTSIGGIQKAVQYNAVSVDHLEIMENDDYKCLKNSKASSIYICFFILINFFMTFLDF